MPCSGCDSAREPGGIGGCEGHRSLRADAWRHAAGFERPRATAGNPVERRAVRCRMRRAGGARAGLAKHHRQSRHAWIHGTQADLGGRKRGRGLLEGDEGVTAQGLRAPSHDRRACFRDVRCVRDLVAGCCGARVVRSNARGNRAFTRPHATPRRGKRAGWLASGLGCGRVGRARRGAGCRWRRRQRRGSGRDRCGHAGFGLPVARHVGGPVRLEPRVLAESRTSGARILSLPPRHVAPDERHPERRLLLEVGDGTHGRHRRGFASG